MATIEKREGTDGVRYRVRVRIKGEKSRTRTFKRKTDADLWSKKVESDLGHGVYVPTTADRRRTLAELIDKFIVERSADRNRVAHLQWWRDHAGHLTLDRVNPQAIAGFRSELLARRTGRRAAIVEADTYTEWRPDVQGLARIEIGKAIISAKLDKAQHDAKATQGVAAHEVVPITQATANRYLAALSAVCKWAWKELRWLQSNPVLSVTKGAESAGIIRYLSDDERKALLTACKASTDPNIYCAVMLALATGARYSNIRNLTWADVDMEKWRLRFKHTKNDQPRYVPVVGPAQRVLQEQFDRDPTKAGWIFKGARDAVPADINRPWRIVRRIAGLVGDKHCRFHDIRHTTASYLTMNGASLAEVAEALGQRTLVMAKRYSHQSGEHVRATLERISGQLNEE